VNEYYKHPAPLGLWSDDADSNDLLFAQSANGTAEVCAATIRCVVSSSADFGLDSSVWDQPDRRRGDVTGSGNPLIDERQRNRRGIKSKRDFTLPILADG
jgi:hypothetical protein